jgi:hypothetical protein
LQHVPFCLFRKPRFKNLALSSQKGYQIEAFEAQASPMKKPKSSRSAHSFINAYSLAFFYVVNLNLRHETVIGKTTVIWLTHLDFIDILGRS